MEPLLLDDVSSAQGKLFDVGILAFHQTEFCLPNCVSCLHERAIIIDNSKLALKSSNSVLFEKVLELIIRSVTFRYKTCFHGYFQDNPR